MKQEDEWIPYTELDWNDEKFNVFSIDTRDFHAGYRFEKKKFKNYTTISKYDHFFHTEQEVKDLLDRYYNESGGEGEWRMFNLDTIGDAWSMKYIRIWRTEKGFIICNEDHYALRKDILAGKVDQEYLGHH